MQIVIIARDKPGSLDLRQAVRAAHLDYIAATGVVDFGGPLVDANGAMTGSLIVLNVADMGDAEAWAASDPYAKAGLFASVTLDAWRRVVG